MHSHDERGFSEISQNSSIPYRMVNLRPSALRVRLDRLPYIRFKHAQPEVYSYLSLLDISETPLNMPTARPDLIKWDSERDEPYLILPSFPELRVTPFRRDDGPGAVSWSTQTHKVYLLRRSLWCR